MEFNHVSVLLNECLEGLNIKENGIYVDGTLGGAGHSSEILKRLSKEGRLIGIDQDTDALKAAKERLYLLDFYNGNTDSDVFDDELKTAIKDFQKANDLLSYGVLDIPTQKKIEKVFSKIEVTTDNQFEKAYELMGGNLEDLN